MLCCLFHSRVQHFCSSHFHLQSRLHATGLSVFTGIMYWQRQRKRLPPQTCWHVLCICRWVELPECHEAIVHSNWCSLTSLFPRPLFLHLTGGDASVGQTDDREHRHHLDGVFLLLVFCLRLHRLRPPLSLRHRPPASVHAPDAQESMGDLHGCWTRASGVITAQTDEGRMRVTASFVLITGVRFISRTAAGLKGHDDRDWLWCGWTIVILGNLPPYSYKANWMWAFCWSFECLPYPVCPVSPLHHLHGFGSYQRPELRSDPWLKKTHHTSHRERIWAK